MADEENTNLGSIGSLYVPSGVTDTGYCVHAEFFFHVTDPTKGAYFSCYSASGYSSPGGHVVLVNDASLTYEFISE